MESRRDRPAPRVRMTLAERKQQTRDALVLSALETFARDGYHAASLETIATDAGYSKGAIYSNFQGKAELFMAVLDFNLEQLRGDDWDPFHPSEQTAADESADIAESMVRGFSLATLEFIATAARDDTLIDALRPRVQGVIDSYRRVAEADRPADEQLPADDVARLMTALDQGVSVLILSGVTEMNGALLRTGLRRLMDPHADSNSAFHDDADESALPDVERVRRLIRDSRDR